MDYDEVVAATFHPSPPGTVPPPTVDASAARRLRDAVEPLAMHAVWSRETNTALAALGLDFLGGYVWGRASALGEAGPGVVAAAFAVFETGLVRAVYDHARQVCDRQTLIAARDAATVASLARTLRGIDVAPEAEALRAAVGGLDVAGRPLFGGLTDQPWPSSDAGTLWRACELVREHRGDSHVAVCLSRGLGPVEMNVLTELWVGMPLGTYSATRGWSPEAIAGSASDLRARGLMDGEVLSREGVTFRSTIEAETDALEQPLVDALGPSLDGVVAQLEDWSQRCIDDGAFPPDVYKRAAG